MTYFSEREEGECPREHEDICESALGGIQTLVCARIKDGSFGASYPATCDDGASPIGSDESAIWQAMRAEIPTLQQRPWDDLSEEPPRTLDILDMIEFCWRCIGKPICGGYHEFFKHHHLQFDIEVGRDDFRDDVNRIFRRNGLAYELTEQGCIERLVAPVLREELTSAQFRTGDAELNSMLETARCKFFDPDEAMRHEALKVLWDVWERLKTLDGPDKKAQVTSLLDGTAGSSSPKFRATLEREARELTSIGNSFQIRHSETSQEQLAKGEHVDYLFHRLFCFIQMILRMDGWV